MVIEKLIEDVSEYWDYLQRRFFMLLRKIQQNPKNKASLEGMKNSIECILQRNKTSYEQFRENGLNPLSEQLIEILYNRGYELIKNTDFNLRELQFKKQFSHKQVRIPINDNGFRLLLDQGAGIIYQNNNQFLNPNATRIDYFDYTIRTEGLSKTFFDYLEFFEHRASDKAFDDAELSKMRKSIGLE